MVKAHPVPFAKQHFHARSLEFGSIPVMIDMRMCQKQMSYAVLHEPPAQAIPYVGHSCVNQQITMLATDHIAGYVTLRIVVDGTTWFGAVGHSRVDLVNNSISVNHKAP